MGGGGGEKEAGELVLKTREHILFYFLVDVVCGRSCVCLSVCDMPTAKRMGKAGPMAWTDWLRTRREEMDNTTRVRHKEEEGKQLS